MAFWAAVRFEPSRSRLACHCLKERGFVLWVPVTREERVVQGRRQKIVVPLFGNYGFAVIELQWYAIKTCPGVGALVMNGERPAKVPDRVIVELKGRERDGVIELPKPRRLRRGDRVKVTEGAFKGKLAIAHLGRARPRFAAP